MPKHFLSICAFIKNEAPYLAEWLAFHRLQGVEKFYLYLNSGIGEDLETKEAVSNELDKGDIDFVLWPGSSQQCKAYQDCLDQHGDESEWIAFIDTDEFLWAPIRRKTGENILWTNTRWTLNRPEFVDSKVGAVAAHWFLFGSNGHKEKTDGLVIERFTRRAATPDKHIKSIVRPRAISSVSKNPHAFYLRPSFHAISEHGTVLPREYARVENPSADIIRINHYTTKSHAEYVARKRLGDANSGIVPTEDRIADMFWAHDCNEVEDTVLRDLYAQLIKEKLW